MGGLFGFVRAVPGLIVAALAFLLYPGAGLVLPLVLHWSVLGLVEANVVGTLWALVLVIGWLLVQIEARDRRHLMDWTTDLRLLSAEEFEWFAAELFRREGWDVQETGSQEGPDGNIDLILSRQGERRIVQCKRWQSRQVGVNEIRGFAGTLMHEQLPGEAGIFVTLSNFNDQACAEAQRIGLTLIDCHDLYRRVTKARRTEPCPTCEAPMAVRHSQYGWWLRCEVRGCRGKRHLSDEAGRAVELLLLAA